MWELQHQDLAVSWSLPQAAAEPDLTGRPDIGSGPAEYFGWGEGDLSPSWSEGTAARALPVSRMRAVPSTSPPVLSSGRGRLLLRVDKIRPNPRNVRQRFEERALDELTESIKRWGQLQPVVVRRSPHGLDYELICGERRWRAHQRAGLDLIWAAEWDASDQDALALGLLENIQRVDLSRVEKLAALDQLAEIAQLTGLRRTAARLGIDPSWLSRQIAVRKDPDISPALEAGQIGFGQASELLRAPARERRRLLCQIISEPRRVPTATVRSWVEEARARARRALDACEAQVEAADASAALGPYGDLLARLGELGAPRARHDRDRLSELIVLAQRLVAQANLDLDGGERVSWLELTCILCGEGVTVAGEADGSYSRTAGRIARRGSRLVCGRCGGALVGGEHGTQVRIQPAST